MQSFEYYIYAPNYRCSYFNQLRPPPTEGSLPVHILDRFLRKQNWKFPVTITEVVLLRRCHELIKLNWMRDLPGQKAVTEFYPTRPLQSKTISHRKFTDHTRLKLKSNADNRDTKECEKQKHYYLQKMQKFDTQETQTSGFSWGIPPQTPQSAHPALWVWIRPRLWTLLSGRLRT